MNPRYIIEILAQQIMKDKTFDWKGFQWYVWGKEDKVLMHRLMSEYHPDMVSMYKDVLCLDMRKRDNIYQCGHVSTIAAIKYGTLEINYKLPRGYGMYTNITLTDNNASDAIGMLLAKSGKRIGHELKMKGLYSSWLNPFTYNITPFLLSNYKDNLRGTTPKWYFNDLDYFDNNCKLEWTKERVRVLYNGHKVMDVKNKNVIDRLNSTDGLFLHLVCNPTNYAPDNGHCWDTPFLILDLKYNS